MRKFKNLKLLLSIYNIYFTMPVYAMYSNPIADLSTEEREEEIYKLLTKLEQEVDETNLTKEEQLVNLLCEVHACRLELWTIPEKTEEYPKNKTKETVKNILNYCDFVEKNIRQKLDTSYLLANASKMKEFTEVIEKKGNLTPEELLREAYLYRKDLYTTLGNIEKCSRDNQEIKKLEEKIMKNLRECNSFEKTISGPN